MNRYLVIIEPTATGFSAYSPDIPGCVSTGETRDEVAQNMKEAVMFHLDGLKEEGQPMPQPNTEAVICEIES